MILGLARRSPRLIAALLLLAAGEELIVTGLLTASYTSVEIRGPHIWRCRHEMCG